MGRRLPYRLSAGLVVGCLAAFLVLGGTGGAAVSQAPPKNSVGTAQLKNNAVTSPKIKNNAIVAAKIASNAVVAAKIASNAVGGAKIASNAVSTAKIANDAVTVDKIAANAVTGDNVQDGSIAAVDLAAGVIPPSEALGRFANGPVNIPAAQTTIASLSIPAAGSYVLWAKLYATSVLLAGSVSCRLEAGANFDESQGYVDAGQPATLSLIALNTFTAAGNVTLGCSATPPQQANFAKIVAVRVASLSNSG
jgi:hypothetical protein